MNNFTEVFPSLLVAEDGADSTLHKRADKPRPVPIRSLAPPTIIAMFNVHACARSLVGDVPNVYTRRVLVIYATATTHYSAGCGEQ